MTLEQQVCSLKLAKRLKELGVKQESIFYWNDKGQMMADFNWSDVENEDWETMKLDWYSAFTVAELGELLRPKVNGQFDFCVDFEHLCWLENEADGRAEMLISWLELEKEGTTL